MEVEDGGSEATPTELRPDLATLVVLSVVMMPTVRKLSDRSSRGFGFFRGVSDHCQWFEFLQATEVQRRRCPGVNESGASLPTLDSTLDPSLPNHSMTTIDASHGIQGLMCLSVCTRTNREMQADF